MSLRWRDEIAIHLAPRKLALLRRARGAGGRDVAAIEHLVPAGAAVPAGAEHDFGPALARLAEVLGDSTWRRARARVVVADDRWARYAVVPWPGVRLDAAGRLRHAQYVLGDRFGDAVADWAVTLDDSPPGRPYVACAMPARLRGALEDVLAPALLSLVSLRPQLVVAFDAWRHRLPADDAWFVHAGDGAMAAVRLRGGAWDRVHVARLAPEWGLELERLQAFGRLARTDGAPERLLVDAPLAMRGAVEARPGVEWLEEGDAESTEGRGLALLRRMRA